MKGDRIERYKERRGKEDWKEIGLRGIRKGEERRTIKAIGLRGIRKGDEKRTGRR